MEAFCPDSLIAVGNSRRQVYEHLPNRDVHQRCGDAGLQHTQREGERGKGNPLKTCGKTRTSHTAVSQKRLTSAHAAQPGRLSLILWSTCEKKKEKENATLKCIRGECRKRGRWRASSSLPARTVQSQTLTSPAARLNKKKNV